MRRATIAIVAVVMLAGCGSPRAERPTPTVDRSTASTPAVPVLNCPDVEPGIPKLRVVAEDVTLRRLPRRLASDESPIGSIQRDDEVQYLRKGRGPWRKVRCGLLTGWVLADDRQGTRWLE